MKKKMIVRISIIVFFSIIVAVVFYSIDFKGMLKGKAEEEIKQKVEEAKEEVEEKVEEVKKEAEEKIEGIKEEIEDIKKEIEDEIRDKLPKLENF